MKYLLVCIFSFMTAATCQCQCMIDSIMINALLIDPSGSNNNYDTNEDGIVNSSDEYIELCNMALSQSMDISGWKIGDDDPLPFPDFTIPDGTVILPGACIVLVHDYCEQDDDGASDPCPVPPGVIDMNASSTGLLGNAGDVLTLMKGDNSASCSVVYGNVECDDVDPLDIPGYDPTNCESWGIDIDGCPLLVSGDSCSYQPLVLPVEFLTFTVKKMDNQRVSIDWSTITELNNDRFILEWRSSENRAFGEIGEVLSSNENQKVVKYNFTHINPEEGVNYYRIKQLDLNGNYTVTEVRAISIALSDDIRIYPTLVDDHISINGNKNNYLVSVFHISGNLILEKIPKRNNEFINLSHLHNGYYVMRIFDGQKVVNRSFLKI